MKVSTVCDDLNKVETIEIEGFIGKNLCLPSVQEKVTSAHFLQVDWNVAKKIVRRKQIHRYHYGSLDSFDCHKD